MDITVQELKQRMDAGTAPRVVDVREPWEYEQDHITPSNIPMGQLPTRIEELEEFRNQELVICCRSGGRSGQIARFLEGSGFSNVRNLTGGMLAWKQSIDPKFNVE